MKVGWQKKSLADILLKTETVNPNLSPEADFEYIDVSSVSNQSFQIEETQNLKGKDAPSRARKLVKTNDILFATIRPTLQRIAIVPSKFNNQVCSTGYFVLRPNQSIHYKYLYYYLFADSFMGQMESLQKGASYPAVTDNEVKSQNIPFPLIPEQQRIVAILDQAFEGIAKARANAEQNLQNARALFESHLQSVITDACEKNNLATLSDLATDITDGDHMPPPKAATGIPFITIGNIVKDTRTIDFTDTFKVPAEYFNKLKANKKPKLGDVLYTVTGSFGIPVLVKDNQEFCFQRHIGLIRPKPDVSSEWLCYLLSSPQLLKQANDGATGTAQKTVSLKVLRGFQVPNLPIDKQNEMVVELDALSKETQRLEAIYQRKIALLDELKKSLLQQAFAGAL
jgi:type I restriction enzyme, S subunit